MQRVRHATWLPGRAALLRLANDRLRRQPRGYERAVTDAGVFVNGTTGDLIERYLYVFGTWEPSLSGYLRERLRPGDVFVDIGANIGYFTHLAAHIVGGGGSVLAFEPLPATVAKLRANIEANELGNVTVVDAAASDDDGEVDVFQGPATNVGRSATSPLADGSPAGRVRTVRAAAAIPADVWPRVRAIKVDVEGDELRVIRGLQPLLAVATPGMCLVAEVAPDRLSQRGGAATEVLSLMDELGFSAAAIENDYHPRAYAPPRVHPPAPLTAAPEVMTDVVFTKR